MDAAETHLRAGSGQVAVATMACEALTRLYSLNGLSAGLDYLGELVATRLDGLDPSWSEKDLATETRPPHPALLRIKSFVDDKSRLTEALGFALMFPNDDELIAPATHLSTEQGQLAFEQRFADEPSERQTQAFASATSALENLGGADDKSAAAALYTQLQTADPTFGAEPLKRLVEGIRNAMLRSVPSLAPAAQLPPSDVAQGDAEASAAAPQRSAVRAGAAMTRDDILNDVLQAAARLEAVEPSGFTAPALREVVRRARLSPAELLVEIVPEGSALEYAFLRAGFGLPPASDETAN